MDIRVNQDSWDPSLKHIGSQMSLCEDALNGKVQVLNHVGRFESSLCMLGKSVQAKNAGQLLQTQHLVIQ